MVTLLNLSWSTHPHSKVDGARSRQHGCHWPFPTSMPFLNPSVLCWALWTLRSVAFRPFWTLWQELVHLKDPIPEWQSKGVVNSIPCNECSQAYIRHTGRLLDLLLQSIGRLSRVGMNMAASALTEHAFTAGHKVDLSKAWVIDAHPHAQNRCLLESWHIQHE